MNAEELGFMWMRIKLKNKTKNMKKIIFNTVFILLTVSIYGQKYDNEIICSNDTLVINPQQLPRYINKPLQDTIAPYKAVFCTTKSKIGFRFETGVSSYFYNEKTKDWLGNHLGPNFNFIFVYDKLNLGFRFKPFTVNPKKELVFNNEILVSEALVNPIKFDFYVGYSVDFKYFSIEPYLGLSNNLFIVINQDEINKRFSIPNAIGFINGVSINKYFKIDKYEYIALFANVGYSIVDYTKIHNELGKNYFECSLGIAYKGFFTKTFMKKVE